MPLNRCGVIQSDPTLRFSITAGSPHVSLAKGIIVPILIGTGIFKGATGSIDIAPAAVAEDIFNLTLPA